MQLRSILLFGAASVALAFAPDALMNRPGLRASKLAQVALCVQRPSREGSRTDLQEAFDNLKFETEAGRDDDYKMATQKDEDESTAADGMFKRFDEFRGKASQEVAAAHEAFARFDDFLKSTEDRKL